MQRRLNEFVAGAEEFPTADDARRENDVQTWIGFVPMIRAVATTPSDHQGDAEYPRLAAEAKQLIELRRRMLEDPDSVDFPKCAAT